MRSFIIRSPVLVLGLALAVVGGPSSTILLTSGVAGFTTRRVEVKGCPAVFDSGRKSSPADCFPYPVTIEVVKASVTDLHLRLAGVLQVKVTNTSTAVIRLPKSPEPVLGPGQHSTLSFALYCRPGSANPVTIWLAFADSGTSSSMIDLEANTSVLYELRFDKAAGEQFAKAAKDATELQIALDANSFVGDTSKSQGGPILSPPIELPR